MAKLSDTKIRSAKSRERPYKLYDQDGLFLTVRPNGSRWWRQKHFVAGKEKLLSIGTYPETSLADARTKSAAIRSQVKAGADPSVQRQEQKAAAISAQANTYENVVLRWLEATGREREWTQDHIEAVEILRELHALTGPDGYVFQQARNASRPISENTVNVALRACGYSKEQQTAHGFRSTASTLLNELGFNKDWIERQLAHGERDKSRDSYNSAEYLTHRRGMMQAWADHLDQLRTGRKATTSIPTDQVTHTPAAN